jgi:hypothetical protein
MPTEPCHQGVDFRDVPEYVWLDGTAITNCCVAGVLVGTVYLLLREEIVISDASRRAGRRRLSVI